MRNNNVKLNNNFRKPNTFRCFPNYGLPFGFGLVSYTHFGFNLLGHKLLGYKPGYKFGFNNTAYKNSALLQLLDYMDNRTNRFIRDILYTFLPCPSLIPIKCNT